MPEVVPMLYVAWVAVSLVLFWRLRARDAALVSLIGGWAVLPVARFDAAVFRDPKGVVSAMHALAVPTPYLVNKATVVALGCLLGAVVFDWSKLRRLRPSRLDVPIVAWCLVPAFVGPINGLPLAESLAQSRYLALAWGVPYLMGRAYLVDNESLRRFALALVVAGLAYVPLCLAEFLAGPFLYESCYGPHPSQRDGIDRYVLYRPMVWLEHGNQLGMWVATVAVAAFWLWRSRRLPAVAGIPPGAVVGLLMGVCLLCQSFGGIVLALGVVLTVVLAPRVASLPRPVIYAGVAVLLVGLGLMTAGVLRAGRDPVKDAFRGIGKSSLTFRLGRYEDELGVIAQRPLTGWSAADWSSAADGSFICPAALGLWFLVLGAFGAVGLAAVTCVLSFPLAEVIKWLPLRSWLNPGCSAVTLAAMLLLINAADALFNSVVILPLLAGAGGVTAWSLARFEGH